jgi:hypothetical protein
VFETGIVIKGVESIGLFQERENRREFDKIGIFEAWFVV